MNVIYKYAIPVDGEPVIEMPSGAKVLSFHVQHNKPFIWALVDPDRPDEKRRFYLLGTGHPMSYSMDAMRFIGTALLEDGDFILHLFEMQ